MVCWTSESGRQQHDVLQPVRSQANGFLEFLSSRAQPPSLCQCYAGMKIGAGISRCVLFEEVESSNGLVEVGLGGKLDSLLQTVFRLRFISLRRFGCTQQPADNQGKNQA